MYFFKNNTICTSGIILENATEITKEEYDKLYKIIISFDRKPPTGKYYELQLDGDYVLKDLPPMPIKELTDEEALRIIMEGVE